MRLSLICVINAHQSHSQNEGHRVIDDLASADAIALHVTHLLRNADAGERLPTPIDDIIVVAGLTLTGKIVVSDSLIKRAPTEEMRRLLSGVKRKILGILDRRERVIQIAPLGSTGRKRFVVSHELAHEILPWQADLAVHGDDQHTLSPQVMALFEREANQGAAEILFQQDLLKRMALDYPISFSTPIELSILFGASIHATFRRWVEGLDAAVCGLVLDANLTEGRRKRYEQVLTTRWKQQFGPSYFPRMMSTTPYPFVSQELSKGTFHIDDRDGTPIKLRYETFRTPYRQFALLWLPKQQSFLARHRKRPVILLA